MPSLDLEGVLRYDDDPNLLHEGAIVVAHVSGDPNTAARAKAVAAQLIEEAGGDAKG